MKVWLLWESDGGYIRRRYLLGVYLTEELAQEDRERLIQDSESYPQALSITSIGVVTQ